MKIGIDFGTCFSFIAALIGSDIRTTLLDDCDSKTGMPTVFARDKKLGKEFYGRMAYDRRLTFVNDYIKEIKKDIRIHPERITSDATYTYYLGGKYYKAEEIVKKILKYLIDTALKNARMQGIADTIIDEITITAPVGLNSDTTVMEATALYNEMLIRATKEVTGINKTSNIHILGEPVAAAMYNIHKNASIGNQTVLVYDLGGGTFDAAIIEYKPNSHNKYEILSTGGYTDVGGGDWDNCLKTIVRNKTNFSGIEVEGRGYIPKDSSDAAAFENEITEAKIALSTKNMALVNFIVGNKPYSVTVSREEFEKESESFLNKTMEIVKDVITSYERIKGLNVGDGIRKIDRIVLVGGSSQMPQVKNGLIKLFPKFKKESIYLDSPQLAIAAGAALNNNTQIISRIMHTYGIDTCVTVTKNEYNDNKNEIYFDYALGKEKNKYFIAKNGSEEKYKKYAVSNILMKGAMIDSNVGYASASSNYYPLYDSQKKVGFEVHVSETAEQYSELEKPALFSYSVDIPKEYYGKASKYKITAEFRITNDGVVILKTYDENGKEIGYGRFPE